MKKRRKLTFALGASILAAPLHAFAQQKGKVWRVGFLASDHRPASLDGHPYGGFLRGMHELGYIEGKNIVIEWRFADVRPDQLPVLAEELVRLNVDVLVAQGAGATRAGQRATTTIPIVMVGPGDPVDLGLVKTLARPGGNTTGLSTLARETTGKRLEMLLEMTPKVARVAILMDPNSPAHIRVLQDLQTAGEKRRVDVLAAKARTSEEIEDAFVWMRQQNAGAVWVAANALFTQQRTRIVELATKHRLPSIAQARAYAEAGGLMSYGPNVTELNRRAATYVDKILKGAKPGDLPIEQPMIFELVINMKTAKALGITIPQTILVRADRVID